MRAGTDDWTQKGHTASPRLTRLDGLQKIRVNRKS